MKTFRRPFETECVLIVVPARAVSDAVEPTEDDFRACGLVPAEDLTAAVAHARDLEGMLTEERELRAADIAALNKAVADRDALRAKLGEAETKIVDTERRCALLKGELRGRIEIITRYAALERAAREWLTEPKTEWMADHWPSYARLRAALDALTPAPTASPAPATSGDRDGADCESCALDGKTDCMPDCDEDGRCRHFTRRLPVVERGCLTCSHNGTGHDACIDCDDDDSGWQPRPAAGEVGNG